MHGFYVFSLLSCIQVHKDHDFKLMHDYVSAYPDVYLSPKVNLSQILNFGNKGHERYQHSCFL